MGGVGGGRTTAAAAALTAVLHGRPKVYSSPPDHPRFVIVGDRARGATQLADWRTLIGGPRSVRRAATSSRRCAVLRLAMPTVPGALSPDIVLALYQPYPAVISPEFARQTRRVLVPIDVLEPTACVMQWQIQNSVHAAAVIDWSHAGLHESLDERSDLPEASEVKDRLVEHSRRLELQ